MMRWLLENIQVVIAVVGVIAYWLNQRHRAKQGLPADFDGDGIPENKPTAEFDPTTMEVEEAERTRKLMEEMRRKRVERQGEVPAATPVSTTLQQPASSQSRRMDAPSPVFKDPMAEMMKELAKRLVPAEEQKHEVDEEILARQRALEEKLRQLDAEREAALKRVAALASSGSRRSDRQTPASAASVPSLSALYDPETLRQVIVMNEILGKPVGLRSPGHASI